MLDAIVIGGSFAGLSAATQLARARRDVVVLDTGLPRNRTSPSAHGLLGYDGAPPEAILTAARFQLGRYPNARVRVAPAISARRTDDGFVVGIDGGDELEGRRLILAHGLVDRLEAIPGMAECWGRTVLHCPYCHGYELAGRRLGFMVRAGDELYLARFYGEWSRDLTLFSNGAPVDPLVQEGLAELGVRLVETAILRFDHTHGRLRAVVAADGRIPIDALFAHPPAGFSSTLGVDLGCAAQDGPFGPYFTVDSNQQTTVEGVYAAGDIARPSHYLSFAIADGAAAGIFAHQSLVS